MKLYLIVARGKRQGLVIPITIDLFMLGSSKVCQLRSGLPGIGPQHCALVTRERKAFITDMNSGEPTLLNGELVPPGDEWPLHAGDRLQVGPLEFLVQFREKPLSQRDLEEWALRCLDESGMIENEEPDEFVSAPAVPARITPSQAAAAILERLQARRGTVKGRLRVGQENGVTLVRFNDVNLVEESEIALVKKELQEELSRFNLRVLLDCKNVKRLSSAAVKMIDEVYSWLRQWGNHLALCRVRPELQEILHTLRLRNSIPHFSDKYVALVARW
ncbi:MAG: FHA domain-containing protein [Gemmataceae bacterium]|nr:FHA domain-containing protein [Gemmataceae bacterium]